MMWVIDDSELWTLGIFRQKEVKVAQITPIITNGRFSMLCFLGTCILRYSAAYGRVQVF